MQSLEQSVISILNANGTTVGNGVVVTDRLAVTCAHVVLAAGSNPNQPISIQFLASESQHMAMVLSEGWSTPDEEDVAFLELGALPQGVTPALLGTAKGRIGHPYTALGSPILEGYHTRYQSGLVQEDIVGIAPVRNVHKRPMLQLKHDGTARGMSGAPVLDVQTSRVIGLVSEYKDDERNRLVWATTADTLASLSPALWLWPDTYGPDELDAYLDYLIKTNQTLLLPDGREVPLDHLYVSLRAAEMNAGERQAERDLYLEDVAALQNSIRRSTPDQYAEFAAVRKAVVNNPRMSMLESRTWSRLLNERQRGSLNLAEVVQRHPAVVLLGDPGSGKTTLGKWLVLQFARALRQNEPHVQVRVDLMSAGVEVGGLVDLGPVRLPIFIRLADYARARWDSERGDAGLQLERFIGFHQNPNALPPGLTSEAIGALTREYLDQGRALVVLDGLDEVGDPAQRRAVAQTVKKFIQAQASASSESKREENQILLTSRIVGYQFDPLSSLPHYTIEEMDDMAITTFCRAWMISALGIEKASQQAEELIEAIFAQAHPGVRSLAGNPLLLTILAHVYMTSAERALPTRRASLFEAATRALYEQRKDFWNRAGLTLIRLTRALGAVAAYIQSYEVTGFTEEGVVRAQLTTVLNDYEQVEAVLQASREVSGLLVARGEGVYGFLQRGLQEYFAAQHLISRPEEVAQDLTTKCLDPTWREPIVLAIGLVSQPSYPGSRHRLPEVFAALLDTPDPIGDFLPRRELLAVEACSECERVSPQTAQLIVDRLLNAYPRREGRDRSPVLAARIQRAFTTLRTGPAKVETEATLCAAAQDSDSQKRYAAINIIIETKWDSPVITQALVTALKTYADPAASLLTVLDDLSDRQPSYFRPGFLPLRRTVESEPTLWEQASVDTEWQAIISLLYLPLGAGFIPGLINRDSPLTVWILDALSQTPAPEVMALLRSVKSAYKTLERQTLEVIDTRDNLPLPDWSKLETLARAPSDTAFDALMPTSWRPWLVRLVACLGYRNRGAETQWMTNREALLAWLKAHYGRMVGNRLSLPTDFVGWFEDLERAGEGVVSVSTKPESLSPLLLEIYPSGSSPIDRRSLIELQPVVVRLANHRFSIWPNHSNLSGMISYRQLATTLPEELIAELRQMGRMADPRKLEVILEIAEGLHGPCWEAMVTLADKSTIPIPGHVPFQFRRVTSESRLPWSPARDAMTRIVICVANEMATKVSQRGWSTLSQDKHFDVQVTHTNILWNTGSAFEAADVLHLIGTAEETSAGVRFHLTEEQAHRISRSLQIQPESSRLVRAVDVKRTFPNLMLCVIQGEPEEPETQRREGDRRDAMLARVFAAELFAQGLPAVLVLPPLAPPLAATVLERVAVALQLHPHQGTRALNWAFAEIQTLIVKNAGIDVEAAWELALDTCLYATGSEITG